MKFLTGWSTGFNASPDLVFVIPDGTSR